MPQIQSAKKRVRTQARQTAENRLHRARSRTALKRVRELTVAGNVKEAVAEVATVQTYLDKAAKTGAWHPNTAARYKSRLAAALKKAGNSEVTPARTKVTSAKKPAPKKSAPRATVAKSSTKPAATKSAKPVAKPVSKPAAKKAS
jgi:small subunit ribosomal protein S20